MQFIDLKHGRLACKKVKSSTKQRDHLESHVITWKLSRINIILSTIFFPSVAAMPFRILSHSYLLMDCAVRLLEERKGEGGWGWGVGETTYHSGWMKKKRTRLLLFGEWEVPKTVAKRLHIDWL